MGMVFELVFVNVLIFCAESPRYFVFALDHNINTAHLL